MTKLGCGEGSPPHPQATAARHAANTPGKIEPAIKTSPRLARQSGPLGMLPVRSLVRLRQPYRSAFLELNVLGIGLAAKRLRHAVPRHLHPRCIEALPSCLGGFVCVADG